MPPSNSSASRLTPGATVRPATSEDANLSGWFAAEAQAHDTSLKAYLRHAFPAVRDIEDVVQESYLRLWRARLAGTVESARGFLFCAARRLAIDFLRRDRRAPLLRLGDPERMHVIDEGPDARDHASEQEKILLLAEALDALPPRQRQMVILCKLQSKPHREVAANLGLSEKTVTEHVYRGVQRLGLELQRRGIRRFTP